ncbi:MAG: choice-of-anchor L domain-containing protein [Brevibacterium yomogidense]|uniref:choice-of-anchor L domain-containing protein n=1 Tax=Brevibacterium yomogidense TaxID=946573 RepID=UPI0011784C41|nr:choice-of-anchor L domain-containing protein [Brevibacterium yomogidense]
MRTERVKWGALAAASALIFAGLVPTAAQASPAAASAERSAAAAADGDVEAASPGQEATDLTSGDLTADDLVETLIGEGITYSNAVYTGAAEGAGEVTGMSAVGVEGGVALSSGSIADSDLGPSSVLGPNELTGNTSVLGVPGDSDLNLIVDPLTTMDASVLEFDFVPDTDQVKFTYVFGSDEYNEYVDSDYNDVFGFYVNGSNCAVVDTDEGTAPVTINTINNGVNSSLYNDNDAEAGHPHETEMDGFTEPLVCASDVTPGETNHVKLAIADTADATRDSAVLISAGTFAANTAPTAEDATYTTTIDTPVSTPLVASDPDGDELTYTVVEEPAEGTLSGDAPDLTYTPAEGYEGQETFTFTANDGAEDSNVATVTVNVVDEAPTAEPTVEPTAEPTQEPSAEPTDDPTTSPSPAPSETPAPAPEPEPSADPQPGEDLPRTGSDIGVALTAGGLLTAAGAVFLFIARRRRA